MSGSGILHAMVKGGKSSWIAPRKNSSCVCCFGFILGGTLFWFYLEKWILLAPSKYHLQNMKLQNPQNISSSSGVCKYINLLFSRGKMVCFRWILDVNSKQVDRAAGGRYQASHRGPTPYSCRKWITEIGGKGNQICQAEYSYMKRARVSSKL